MGGNFCGSMHSRRSIAYENLLSMKILTPLKQNGHGRSNLCGIQESASVCLKAWEYDQYAMAMENRIVKGHLPQKVSCVYTLFMKKGGHIHCRVAGQQRYLVDLCQGSIRVELHYSGIIFRGSNFSWCFNFRGFNFYG